MKKITVKLTAVVLSAFIFLGGVGGSYIEGYCAEPGTRFLDVVWNYDDPIGVNILQYVSLIMAYGKACLDPSKLSLVDAGIATTTFLTYMNSDKGAELTEEEIPQYFEENVRIHSGGGLSFSDDIVDALHHTAQAIIDDSAGYVSIPTYSSDDVSPSWFTTKAAYYAFLGTLESYKTIYWAWNSSRDKPDFNYYLFDYYRYATFPSYNFYTKPSSHYDKIISCLENNTYDVAYLYNVLEDWTSSQYPLYIYQKNELGNDIMFDARSNEIVLTPDNSFTQIFSTGADDAKYYRISMNRMQYNFFTLDGTPIRIFRSLDAYKAFDAGKQPFYATPTWYQYDYSQDNSVTISNTYLGNVVNGGVVNNYYNVVQDAIDKNNTDGNLTEDQIRDIVSDTIKQIQQDNNTESDSGGSGSDDNGSGGGIIAIIEGIGKFFDTLLTLVGNVIGMIADFGNSVLEMFGSLGTFTEGFSSFLTGTFGFIPEEVWKVLISGITLSVLLLGIKLFK